MSIKICYKCKKDKNIEEFRKHKRSVDGYGIYCKECLSKKESDDYKLGKINLIKKYNNQKKRINENKKFIKNFLIKNPCVDCGDTDWWNLEFDHINPLEKLDDINRLMQHAGIEKLKNEIKKCDVRCLKCHRKRTIHQLGWWRIEAFENNASEL